MIPQTYLQNGIGNNINDLALSGPTTIVSMIFSTIRQNVKSDASSNSGIRRWKFWQTLPALFGTLLPISFGTMFGWASVSYPLLLERNSTSALDTPGAPVSINMAQSAMIAGMLMLGWTIGTPFSSIRCLTTKWSILLAGTFALAGWMVMFFARDVAALCTSRILVGLGHGVGLLKLREFVNKSCTPDVAKDMQVLISTSVHLGVVFIFVLAAFVSFRLVALVCCSLPLVMIIAFGCAPKTSVEKLLQKQSQVSNILINTVQESKEQSDEEVFGVLKTVRVNWRKFVVLTWLVFMQQSCGAPSLTVYCILIMAHLGVQYPAYFSILYACLVLVSSYLGVRFLSKLNRFPVLVVSCLLCTLCLVVILAYLHFLPHDQYYCIVPLASILFFGFSHTFGMATVPSLVIVDIFKKEDRCMAICYSNMLAAMLGLIITKIFQLLLGFHNIFAGLSFFTLVLFVSLFSIFIFFKETKPIPTSRM